MNLYDIAVAKKIAGGGGGGGEATLINKNITENGTYNASTDNADGYKKVVVDVPIPDEPSGTINITSNGSHNVKSYATASVSVPVGVFPSGTSSITANGIYDITNFASVDVNVSGGGGGDHDVEDAIIERYISGTYTNNRVARVGSVMFDGNSRLTEVSFGSCIYILSSAFRSCYNLSKISFPMCTNIGSCAFQGCSALTDVFFPEVTNIAYSAFSTCSGLETAVFPKLKSLPQNMFWNCQKLRTASFAVASSVQASVFYSCNSLMSVYFLSTSVAKLISGNTFNNTPMSVSTYTGAYGSIYVPASLVDSYKSASYWSVYADRITAYEE